MAYTPIQPASIEDLQALLAYVVGEFQDIANNFDSCLPKELPELHNAPSKVREFMIVAADGTDWNPGAGKGVYVYYSAAWNKLG